VIVMMTLIAVASMAFAAHQWWRGHHLMAIGFITLALLISGVAIQGAKNNQSASLRGSSATNRANFYERAGFAAAQDFDRCFSRHQRRGAADRGEYREVAGAIAEAE
jgi:hypothetical protein